MSTNAQIAANQANSQHSSGPKTNDGKAASCLNNLKYGLTGSSFCVLPWENEAEYDTLHTALRSSLEPHGPLNKSWSKKWRSTNGSVSALSCSKTPASSATFPPAMMIKS